MTHEAALILIVDDDELMRDVSAECLADQGFAVRVAPNGQEALEMLATIRPALIILDWRMPVMSGEELLVTLRADPSLAAIPAVILTASLSSEITVRGATILQKPVRRKALIEVVASILGPPG